MMYVRLQHKIMLYKLRRLPTDRTSIIVLFVLMITFILLGWYSWKVFSIVIIFEDPPKVVSARGIIDYYPELTETYRDLGMNLTEGYDQIVPIVTRIKEKDCKAVFEDFLQSVLKQNKRVSKYALHRRHAEFTLNGYSFLLEGKQIGEKKMFAASSKIPKYSLEELMEKDVDFSNHKDKRVNGITAMHHAMQRNGLRWQRGLVFGTNSPFVESLALKNRASHVTSISWEAKDEMISVSYLRPDDLASQIQRSDEQIGHYDFIAAFDTINLLGIGRFKGEPIDPNGDMKEMQKLRCLLKDSGIFYLGVPVGADCLYWNNYRIYGQIRLPIILSDSLSHIENLLNINAINEKNVTAKRQDVADNDYKYLTMQCIAKRPWNVLRVFNDTNAEEYDHLAFENYYVNFELIN